MGVYAGAVLAQIYSGWLDNPYLHFGAFGIAALALGILVWHIRYATGFQKALFESLETLQKETNEVLLATNETITMNNAALSQLREDMNEMSRTHSRVLRELLKRPCLLDLEVQQELKEKAKPISPEKLADSDSDIHEKVKGTSDDGEGTSVL